MGVEIERRYLVDFEKFKETFKEAKSILIKQGYISKEKDATVRVRVFENEGYLTIKGKNDCFKRAEYEYSIPFDEANEMLQNLCTDYIIEKIRYNISYKGKIWEIDEFLNENEGLFISEIELETEDEAFEIPSFILQEITTDYRYSNSSLSKKPYKLW